LIATTKNWEKLKKLTLSSRQFSSDQEKEMKSDRSNEIRAFSEIHGNANLSETWTEEFWPSYQLLFLCFRMRRKRKRGSSRKKRNDLLHSSVLTIFW